MTTWREKLVSPAIRARLQQLEQSDAEVRLLHLLLDRKIYEWALSIGTLRDPVLQTLSPPVPPESLRRITANESSEEFLWTGLVDVHMVLELLQAHWTVAPAKAGTTRPRLLDFGCGCGRLLRFLVGQADSLEVHGSDVNADHVDWCRERLAPISFHCNRAEPPLRHEAAAFDGIWSLSVFTHLDERLGARWRTELARVLAPGGLLLLTVHGPTAIARIAAEPQLAERVAIDAERRRTVEQSLESRGFAFVPYDSRSLSAAKAGDHYGLHFVTPAHVREAWAVDGLQLLSYLPGALRGWQDVVLFRRA